MISIRSRYGLIRVALAALFCWLSLITRSYAADGRVIYTFKNYENIGGGFLRPGDLVQITKTSIQGDHYTTRSVVDLAMVLSFKRTEYVANISVLVYPDELVRMTSDNKAKLDLFKLKPFEVEKLRRKK